jgi:hypothetical protein
LPRWIAPIVGLTAYECVMAGVVRIAFYFYPFQTILQQVDIFLHEFLKYWLLIKVGPGTVGDIDNVWHLFSPSFDVCSRSNSECQNVTQYVLDLIPRNSVICCFIRVVMISINHKPPEKLDI